MSNSDTMSSSIPLISPIPINEEQRLAAVRGHAILDTLPEPEFDALARLAAQVCQTPMAALTVIDAERQWFKAVQGLDLRELPRTQAFCAHALAQPDSVLAVDDLSTDPRFAQHILVRQAPHLRFYAGTPIVDEHGFALGSLAVFDTCQRSLAPEQAHSLQDLATLALTAFNKRLRTQQLVHMALSDPLTGLSNRAHFNRTVEGELAHAMRTGEPFTVLCMDLDGFQAVNDGFGHVAGDEVLCEVARRMAQQVRIGDVLARFGSDEFGVVMRHGAKDSAQVLARRIAKAVSTPIMLTSGDEIGVGVSIGMAAYTDRVVSVSMLMAQAEQALFQTKLQNEKRWKMFVGIR